MYLAPKGIFRKTVLFRIAPKEPGGSGRLSETVAQRYETRPIF